jgi:hypothetical protein
MKCPDMDTSIENILAFLLSLIQDVGCHDLVTTFPAQLFNVQRSKNRRRVIPSAVFASDFHHALDFSARQLVSGWN